MELGGDAFEILQYISYISLILEFLLNHHKNIVISSYLKF